MSQETISPVKVSVNGILENGSFGSRIVKVRFLKRRLAGPVSVEGLKVEKVNTSGKVSTEKRPTPSFPNTIPTTSQHALSTSQHDSPKSILPATRTTSHKTPTKLGPVPVVQLTPTTVPVERRKVLSAVRKVPTTPAKLEPPPTKPSNYKKQPVLFPVRLMSTSLNRLDSPSASSSIPVDESGSSANLSNVPTNKTNVDNRKEFLFSNELQWLDAGEKMAKLDLSSLESPPDFQGPNRTDDILKNVVSGLRNIKNDLGLSSRYTPFHSVMKLASYLTGYSVGLLQKLPTRQRKEKKKNKRHMSKKARYLEAAKMITDEDKEDIRFFLEESWKNQRNVTVESMLEWARETIDFKFGRSVLQDILHGMGLCYRVKNHNPLIEERVDLVILRKIYLDRKLELEKMGAWFVFFDETWVYNGMVSVRGWQYKDTNLYQLARMVRVEERRPGPVVGKNKGRRAILLGMMGPGGIIDGTAQVIVSGAKEIDQMMDYHREMNWEFFMKYMETVIEFVKAACPPGMVPVIVIDNAPYHNKVLSPIPTQANKKDVIIKYLEDNGIYIDKTKKITKPELVKKLNDFVQANGGRRAMTNYVFDTWAWEEHGVRVLRLPPYHCMLNPIELIWASLKAHLRSVGATTDSLHLVRERALAWLQNDSPKIAQKCMDHVVDIEDDLRARVGVHPFDADGDDSESDEDFLDVGDAEELEFDESEDEN